MKFRNVKRIEELKFYVSFSHKTKKEANLFSGLNANANEGGCFRVATSRQGNGSLAVQKMSYLKEN